MCVCHCANQIGSLAKLMPTEHDDEEEEEEEAAAAAVETDPQPCDNHTNVCISN